MIARNIKPTLNQLLDRNPAVVLIGPRIPAETLRRFWTMLAHNQGQTHNAAALARGLDVSGVTIARYLGLLADLLLVRRLPPWTSNVGRQLVKAPKVYVRDSGVCHALLGIETLDDLFGHPVIGGSWTGKGHPRRDPTRHRPATGAIALSYEEQIRAKAETAREGLAIAAKRYSPSRGRYSPRAFQPGYCASKAASVWRV